MILENIFTLITPEGKEIVIGAFANEKKAKAAAKRKFPADWLSLCCYPLQQRQIANGEKVIPWTKWQ